MPLISLCSFCFIKCSLLNQMPCLHIWVCRFEYKFDLHYIVNAARWLFLFYSFSLYHPIYLTIWTSIAGFESLRQFWNSSFHIFLSLCTIPADFVASVFTFSLSRCIMMEDFPIYVYYVVSLLPIFFLYGYTGIGVSKFSFLSYTA